MVRFSLFWRRVGLVWVLLTGLSLLTACGGEESVSETTTVGEQVVVVLPPTAEPEAGFDPIQGWGAGEHVHEPLIQSTLTVTTADLEIGYDLATDLTVSADGLVWTATLRSDVFFTDGEPLTAADVAFTYNLARDASTANDLTMLEEAVAVDDSTVEFHLNRPYAIWPYTLATLGIVPEHAYGPAYGGAPIGSGRYQLTQWDRGQQVILTANPDYYGEPVQMDRVVVVFLAEDAALAAVRSGPGDLAYTAATYSEQQFAGYRLLAVPSVDNRGINLPAQAFDGEKGNDFTADPLVRQAIQVGLDREKMIAHVLNGYGAPAYSVCDGTPWASPESPVVYDPDAAGQFLDQAGWVLGADGVREKDGVPARLNLLYPVGDSVRQALAAETANQLSELGIAATIEGVGWDTAYDRAQQEPLVWGWGAHTPMELYAIYHTAPGSDSAAYSPYSNPQVDAYMDQALSAASLEESYAYWQAAQWDGTTGILEDVPWVWLVNVDHLYWVRDGLHVAEQKLHPHGHGWSIVNSVDQWTWGE